MSGLSIIDDGRRAATEAAFRQTHDDLVADIAGWASLATMRVVLETVMRSLTTNPHGRTEAYEDTIHEINEALRELPT